MKNKLNITNLTLWYQINFFKKKTGNTNICFKVFIIEDNLVKNSIKKILLINKTNLRSKTWVFDIALYYVKI